MTVERRITRTAEDPRSMYYAAIAEAEKRGAQVVLDAIADAGHFPICGPYGTAEKRDKFICEILEIEAPR